GDSQAAEPQDRHHGQVEDQHHGREHRGHPASGEHRDTGQVVVGFAEASGLVGLSHEGPDHADAGDLLAQDLVDPVDLLLHHTETRHHSGHDQEHHQGEHRDRDQEEPRQASVLPQGHHDAPDGHHRRHDEHGEPHAQEHLDLLDV